MVKYQVRVFCESDNQYHYDVQNVLDPTWVPSGCTIRAGSFSEIGEIDQTEYTIQQFFDTSGTLVSGVAWLDYVGGMKARDYLYTYDANFNLVSGSIVIYENDGITVDRTEINVLLYDAQFNITGVKVNTI